MGVTELPSGEQFRAIAHPFVLDEQGRAILGEHLRDIRVRPVTWATRAIRDDDADAGVLLHGQQPDGGHRIVDLDYETDVYGT